MAATMAMTVAATMAMTVAATMAMADAPQPFDATQPHAFPHLRVECGMHTTGIAALATDAAGRWGVTGSDDKTVRVWDLATGALERTLRPPVGPGDAGRVLAVALSPDGDLVACGGRTFLLGEGGGIPSDGFVIHLFDRATGRLIRQIPGMAGAIRRLVFSHDGRYLAATLEGGNGLRVYSVANGETVAVDTDYGGAARGADFAPDGGLVTSCDDGFVRLYHADFRLRARTVPPGGLVPASVAFSPDASKIAVGFADSTAVDVLSARDLAWLYAPDTRGAGHGDWSRVSFSHDGRTLLAGGRWTKNGTPVIRLWPQAGRGAPSDWLVESTSEGLVALQFLPSGGVLWATNDPAFGTFDERGRPGMRVAPRTLSWKGATKTLLVSPDGERVRFEYDPGDPAPATFSVRDRAFVLRPESETGGAVKTETATEVESEVLSPPRAFAEGLELAGGVDGRPPVLNGRPLELPQGEIARALAIAPDADSFLLGTESHLRFFDREGREQWSRLAPGAVRAVNIPRRGRVALGAFADGTLRWFRLADGAPLLAFFPHPDRERWVLWTPSGDYDASPRGEELLGWHVNRIGAAGVQVMRVFPGSPAEKAGLEENDILAGLNATVVRSIPDLRRSLDDADPATPLVFRIRRKGEYKRLDAQPRLDGGAKRPRIGIGVANAFAWMAESDFFPVAHFREWFHRPDEVGKVLDTVNATETVRPAAPPETERETERDVGPPIRVARSHPPVATLLSPRDGDTVYAEEIFVRLTIRTPDDAPATETLVLVDGRETEDVRRIALRTPPEPGGWGPDDAILVLAVGVPPRDAELTVRIGNRYGIGDPVRARLRWAGGENGI